MSIQSLFSAIYNGGAKVWSDIEAKVDAVIQKIAGKVPGGVAVAAATESSLKQQLSNALALADTELGAHLGVFTAAAETAGTAFIDSATGGAAVPANPAIAAVIGLGIAQGKAVLDALEANFRAGLHLPAADGAPSGAAVVTAAVGAAAGQANTALSAVKPPAA